MSSTIQTEDLSFAKAMSAVKHLGCIVARKGWNGKNMCIYLQKGSEVPYDKCKYAVRQAIAACVGYEPSDDIPVRINDHIDMICANGSVTCGWVASQTDMLADDWYILK